MDYRTAQKVRVGDNIMVRTMNYECFAVLDIVNNPGHSILFRTTGPTVLHTNAVLPLSADELAKIFLKRKNLKVFINHNNETGEELFSVQVVDSDGFWLDSFKTEAKARSYIQEHQLVEVR